MATILHRDLKFLKIRETMKREAKRYAEVWNYPENWRGYGVMEKIIDQFIQDLRASNIQAYNEANDEFVPICILPQTPKGQPDCYQSDIELLQSFHSVRYNLDNENINGCADKLAKLCCWLAEEICYNLPEYKLVNVWTE